MLVDAFLFFNEFEILDIHLHEMAPIVDRFVLVEADITFSGNPKPFWFEENKQRFAEFLPKIVHIKVTDTPTTTNPWNRETFQRNAIARGFAGLTEHDTIIVADVDEIPRRTTIEAISKSLAEPKKLCMLACSGYVNLYWNNDWHSAVIAPYTTMSPQELRNSVWPTVDHAGWHFSSCGGAGAFRLKLSSFSHQEYNTPQFNEVARIDAALKAGTGLFHDTGKGSVLEIKTPDFPEYLVENQDKFASLIRKDK